MAVTSLEVAAVFALKDEASAVLKRMSEEVKVFTKFVNEAKEALTRLSGTRLSGLNTRLSGLSEQAERAGKAFTGAFLSVDRAASSAIVQVNALAAAMRGIQATAKAGLVPALGGRGGGGGGGGRSGFGARLTGPNLPTPGGHASLHGNPAAMGAIGAAAYGLYEEAELQDTVTQMLFHAGKNPTAVNKANFRSLIQNTAAKTGYGYHDVGEAATDAIRLLRNTPGNGLDILPELLLGGATEARLKGTGLKAAVKSIVELTHMTKEYDPAQVKAMLPLFSFLSIANPATPEQMVRAASYAMPTLQSMMNVDPADVLLATTALARAGATNTKAGTWVRAGFERALPPDVHVTGKDEYARRMYALRAVGLVDENGKSTVLNAAGNLDIDKMLGIVDSKTHTMPLAEKNAMMKKVFGEQGERGVSLLMSPAVREQTAQMKKDYPGFIPQYNNFNEMYTANSPVQQARRGWQDLTNVLADIGQTALPPVVGGLRALDSALNSLRNILPKTGDPFGPPKTGSFGEALGKGAGAGATLGAATGAAFGFLGGGIGAIPGAGLGAAFGAATGAAVYGGAWMLGIDPNTASKTKSEVQSLNPAIDQTGKAANSAAAGVNNLNGALNNFMNSWGGGLPSNGVGPKKMNYLAPPGGAGPVLHAHLHLDGEKIGHAVTRTQVAAAQFPNAIGGVDTYGSWTSPGTGLIDAA